MTRETKAGLVVSCSFVCLVGTVLFSKLREPEATLAEAPAGPHAVEEEQPGQAGVWPWLSKEVTKGATSLIGLGLRKPPPDKAAAVADLAGQKDGKSPTQAASGLQPALFQVPAAAALIPAAKPSPTAQANGQAGAQGTVPPKAALGPSRAGQAVAPPPALTTAPIQELGGPVDDRGPDMGLDTKNAEALPATPARPPASVFTTVPLRAPAKTKPPAGFFPKVSNEVKKGVTSLLGLGLRRPSPSVTLPLAPVDQTARQNLGGQEKTEGVVQPRIAAPIQPPPAPPPAAPTVLTKITPPASSSDRAGSRVAPPPSLTPTPAPDKAIVPAPAPSFATEAPAAGQETRPRAGLTGIAPSQDLTASNRNGQGAPGRVPYNPPTADDAPDKSAANGMRLRSPSLTVPASEQVAQRPIPVAQRPIIAPLPAAGAQIESYDEETHTCKANDTFRTISQTYYQTDRYERALLLFNRNHPLAGDEVRQNPPVLRAGQAVYVPEMRILEKYYASAVPTDAVSAPTGQGTSATLRALAVTPAAASATGGAAVPVAQARIYKVRGNGEMYREIARRTLGDGDRWTDIYNLNRRYDPREPIPAGSELRLPADARVEPSDAP